METGYLKDLAGPGFKLIDLRHTRLTLWPPRWDGLYWVKDCNLTLSDNELDFES